MAWKGSNRGYVKRVSKGIRNENGSVVISDAYIQDGEVCVSFSGSVRTIKMSWDTAVEFRKSIYETMRLMGSERIKEDR
jgi:hypothetical protein